VFRARAPSRPGQDDGACPCPPEIVFESFQVKTLMGPALGSAVLAGGESECNLEGDELSWSDSLGDVCLLLPSSKRAFLSWMRRVRRQSPSKRGGCHGHSS
jgi:hypothetical protein